MANGKWQTLNGKWFTNAWRHLPFAICLLPFAMSFVVACPLCKESLTQGMAKGFYWSILLMLAVPMVVVGTIAEGLWRAGRKKDDPQLLIANDFHDSDSAERISTYEGRCMTPTSSWMKATVVALTHSSNLQEGFADRARVGDDEFRQRACRCLRQDPLQVVLGQCHNVHHAGLGHDPSSVQSLPPVRVSFKQKMQKFSTLYIGLINY